MLLEQINIFLVFSYWRPIIPQW